MTNPGTFYTQPLPRCHRCEKPATQRLLASGAISYGTFCDPCVKIKKRELEKYYGARP